ncbi:hypothetical protein MVES_003485 [Malassezia vespertilionis]|uniref:OBG-type G domain-containing protein n=1 Tax=Malassezia vespertilionis TaxID=2020962 RepID=A0A2N1J7J9_9BASI|nr:hypothetical protein MVES_003485 [Malassezia vespertilionis]
MGVVEKMKEIEQEMARTQKNKATEYHIGLLRAKLAKLRMQLLEPDKKNSKPGEGFDVMKSGNARVVLIGFPSVGKSTLLSTITETESATAAYEYTTLTAIPGVLEYEGARIQLLDLPGIIEGAAQGRGRGRQVVSVAKTADLVLMMLDATKPAQQRQLLEKELEDVGVRLNQQKPDVILKRKNGGGIVVTKAMGLTLTKIDEKMIRSILQGYKIHNCDIMMRQDITVDQFIDVVLGNRKYVPCLYVYNKIDRISMEEMDKLAHQPQSVVISAELRLNLDYLIERIWEDLDLHRIYTKKRGEHPDLSDPIVVRRGATIEHVCHGVHRALVDKFAYALVYGKSSKFPSLWKIVAGVLTLSVAVVAWLVSRDPEWQTDALLKALDYKLSDLGLDTLKYNFVLPKDIRLQLGNILSSSHNWFETLDFKIGRELAEAGAKPEHPVILLPGIISTGLESWTSKGHSAKYFRERLWAGNSMIKMVLFDKDRWVRHLKLDPKTGLDPSGVHVRAAKGLDAASYFAAGYWIWSKIIQNLAAVGYDINKIYLASYDWRLSMYNLEIRDHFYSELKSRFELNLAVTGKKTVFVSHSMGATVALYFFKWIEEEVGSEWIEKHVESLVSISGTWLGVPKAVAALFTGEMRDTVEVPRIIEYLLEHFFSSHERANLFRSWAGSSSLLIKGGDLVWGNEHGAPDDHANASVTQGNLLEYAARGNVSEDLDVTEASQSVQSRKFTTDATLPLILQHTPIEYQNMIATNYSFGFEKDAKQIQRNNKDPRKWTNPLEVQLPNAPSMKIYCIYGWGKSTERSYWMRAVDAKYSVDTDGMNFTDPLDNANSANQTVYFPQMEESRIDSRINFENGEPVVNSGCRMGEGDGTVALLSLGAMCVEGWKRKRYNPAGIEIITHEVKHEPDVLDIRGGPSTADHVDILGNAAVNEMILNVATGRGHLVKEHIGSPIREFADNIAWD